MCILQDDACNTDPTTQVNRHVAVIDRFGSEEVVCGHSLVIPNITPICQDIIRPKLADCLVKTGGG